MKHFKRGLEYPEMSRARRRPILIIFSILIGIWLFHDVAAATPMTDALAYIRGKDCQKAMELLMPLAEGDDPTAQFFLALCYERQGSQAGDAAAVKWFRRAADQGHSISQALLGDMLRWGKGVERNDPEAVAWYRKSSAQGRVEGQRGLGIMLSEGRGVNDADIPQAVELFRKTLAQGDAASAVRLNEMILRKDDRAREVPDERYSPLLCYLASLHLEIYLRQTESVAKGQQPTKYRARPQVGCVMQWYWTAQDWRWMIENVEPFTRLAEEQIDELKFSRLPSELEISFSAREESCLRLSKRKVKPKLVQEGFNLRIEQDGQHNIYGAIAGNRIVFVPAVNKDVEFDQAEISVEAVYGEWDGSSATLTNTLGTCIFQLTASGKKH